MTDIALDEKLAPCPHCGEREHLYPAYRLDKDGKPVQPPYAIDCLGCGHDFTPRDGIDARAAWNRRTSPSQVAPANPAQVMDAMVEHMVQQFLRWKLPDDFAPDGGISFAKVSNVATPYEYRHEPVGTNLFGHTQATAMVRYMLEGLTAAIGAGGQAVAWTYELAGYRDQVSGEYLGWAGTQISLQKPCVPDGSIRNLRPLYALSQPHPADERVVEALPRPDAVAMTCGTICLEYLDRDERDLAYDWLEAHGAGAVKEGR